MPIFEQFPYTNLHELNLDYILETQRKQEEAFENVIEEATEIKDSTIQYKDEAKVYRDETSVLKDETKGYRDETEAYHSDTQNIRNTMLNSLTQIAKNTNDISANSARIDKFTSLTEGSTTGDAELQDIRVANNGVTYDTAGDSVRAQVTEAENIISNTYQSLTYSQYAMRWNGENATKGYKGELSVLEGQTFYITGYTYDSGIMSYLFLGNNEVISSEELTNNAKFTKTVTVPENADTLVINGRYNDEIRCTLLSDKPNKTYIDMMSNKTVFVSSYDSGVENGTYLCTGEADQVIINQAIQSLPASGGIIHLSRGTFYINGAILIDRPITIEGEGLGLTLDTTGTTNKSNTTLKHVSDSGYVIQISTNLKGVTIKDLQITGLGISNSLSDTAILIDQYTDLLYLENVCINNVSNAIYLTSNGRLDAFSMTNCSIQRVSKCLDTQNGRIDNSRIVNNIFWDCVYKGSGIATGLTIKGSNNIIMGNHFGRMSYDPASTAHNVGCSIYLIGGSSSLIEGNYFAECFYTPIVLQNTWDNQIVGNHFTTIGWHGMTYDSEKCCINLNNAIKTFITNNHLTYVQSEDGYDTSCLLFVTSGNRNLLTNNAVFAENTESANIYLLNTGVSDDSLTSENNYLI